MAQARRSFRRTLLVLTAAAGCSGRVTAPASVDGSAPESTGGGAGTAGDTRAAGSRGVGGASGASNAAMGGAGDLGAGGNRDASTDWATGGNAGVDTTGDGQAPWPCPKP